MGYFALLCFIDHCGFSWWNALTKASNLKLGNDYLRVLKLPANGKGFVVWKNCLELSIRACSDVAYVHVWRHVMVHNCKSCHQGLNYIIQWEPWLMDPKCLPQLARKHCIWAIALISIQAAWSCIALGARSRGLISESRLPKEIGSVLDWWKIVPTGN